MTRVLYSCVLDAVPAMYQQVMTWAWTAIDLAGVEPSQLVVHGVEGCDEQVRRHLEDLGVTWVPVARFPYGTAMCNKLAQLESEVLQTAEGLALTDCDLAWLLPVDETLCEGRPHAKVVDVANPPLEVLATLALEAGFPDVRLARVSLGGAPTLYDNCNGGLYCLSSEWLERLREPWPRWLRWVGERGEQLGPYAKHMFQVSFALAMQASGHHVEHLPLEYNCPTHVTSYGEARFDGPIRALHYHRAVEVGGDVAPNGIRARGRRHHARQRGHRPTPARSALAD